MTTNFIKHLFMGEFQAKRVITENFSSLPVNQFGIRNKFWGRRICRYFVLLVLPGYPTLRPTYQYSDISPPMPPHSTWGPSLGLARRFSPPALGTVLSTAPVSLPHSSSHQSTLPSRPGRDTPDCWWLLIILWQCFRQLSSGNGNGTTVPLSPLLNIHKLNWYRSLGFKQE